MSPRIMLLVTTLVLATAGPAAAQSCRDVPRLAEQMRVNGDKMDASVSRHGAGRDFGSVCPAGRKFHAALNGLVAAISKDPGRCGVSAQDAAKLRTTKEWVDIHSDCGAPGL